MGTYTKVKAFLIITSNFQRLLLLLRHQRMKCVVLFTFTTHYKHMLKLLFYNTYSLSYLVMNMMLLLLICIPLLSYFLTKALASSIKSFIKSMITSGSILFVCSMASMSPILMFANWAPSSFTPASVSPSPTTNNRLALSTTADAPSNMAMILSPEK